MPKHGIAAKLIDKIRELPPDKISVVEEFVDSLRTQSDEQLSQRAVTKLSEQAFQKVWDNDDDAEYDHL